MTFLSSVLAICFTLGAFVISPNKYTIIPKEKARGSAKITQEKDALLESGQEVGNAMPSTQERESDRLKKSPNSKAQIGKKPEEQSHQQYLVDQEDIQESPKESLSPKNPLQKEQVVESSKPERQDDTLFIANQADKGDAPKGNLSPKSSIQKEQTLERVENLKSEKQGSENLVVDKASLTHPIKRNIMPKSQNEGTESKKSLDVADSVKSEKQDSERPLADPYVPEEKEREICLMSTEGGIPKELEEECFEDESFKIPTLRALKELGNFYEVRHFCLRYANDLIDPPISVEELEELIIELHPSTEGYVAPHEGYSIDASPLYDLPENGAYYSDSALVEIAKTIVNYFNEKGYFGIYVQVSPDEISEKGRDLRQEKCDLTFLIYTTRLRNLCIQSLGPYVPRGGEVENRAYNRIKNYFPLNCNASGDCFFNTKQINEYLYRLNRYPGRIINAELGGYPGEGTVDLSLVVNEQKPWHFYANVANVGTQNTGHILGRVGFVDYQFTRHDDTLAIEYAMTRDIRMQAVNGHYEAPIWGTDRLRWRIDGSYSNYKVPMVDLFFANLIGNQWRAGPSLIVNVYQHKDLFIDLSGGIFRYYAYSENDLTDVIGSTRFLLPTVALNVERRRRSSNFSLAVSWQKNLWKDAKTNPSNLANLGRLLPSASWHMFEYDLYVSAHLPLTAKACAKGKVVSDHEFSLTSSGQYCVNFRMIPQMEGVIGGLYSVRGYPQSAAVGDNVYFAQLEYHYYFLQPLCCQASTPYARFLKESRLMFRTFFDWGRARFNNVQAIQNEDSSTLYGTGIGLEYDWKRNFMIRGDLGVALKSLQQPGVNAGTLHGYFSLTWMF